MAEAQENLAQTLTLIRRARGGDDEARDRLFRRYSGYALEVARGSLGTHLRRKVDPEDLAQSALVEVWRDFRRFDYRGLGSLDRYVRKVVENKIRDKAAFWSAQRRDAALERPLVSGGVAETTREMGIASNDLSTTQVVSREETRDRVRRALKSLPESQGKALELFLLEGLSLKEVADRLGLPGPDAARMRVQRARKALGNLLEPPE